MSPVGGGRYDGLAKPPLNGIIGMARALNTGRLVHVCLCCPMEVVDVRLYSRPQPSLGQRHRSRLGISSSLRRFDRSRLRSTTPSPTAEGTSASLDSLPLPGDGGSEATTSELSRVEASESGGDEETDERAVDAVDVLALLLPLPLLLPLLVESWRDSSNPDSWDGDVAADAERPDTSFTDSAAVIDHEDDRDEADMACGESDRAEWDEASGDEAGDSLKYAGREVDSMADTLLDEGGRLLGSESDWPRAASGSWESRLGSMAGETSALRGRSFVSIITMLHYTAARDTARSAAPAANDK